MSKPRAIAPNPMEDNSDSRVALELRKRYDALKRQSDLTLQEKDRIHAQFQALIKVFTN